MKYRSVGKTALTVSEIGFGGWAIGGNDYGYSYGPTRDEDSVRAIEKAIDLGCTYFDTADSFGRGHSEELLGKTLGSKRSQIILATKGGIDFQTDTPQPRFSEAFLTQALEGSLKRLQTDVIDIYHLHHPPFSLIQTGRLFDVLAKFKQEGKVRCVGMSVQHPNEGLLAMESPVIESIQIPYNYLHREAAAELFPKALAKGVGIFVAEPLGKGFLSGKYTKSSVFPSGDIRHHWPIKHQSSLVNQVEGFQKAVQDVPFTLAQSAIRFVLAQPMVSSVVVGCKTADQVQENLFASELVLQLV